MDALIILQLSRSASLRRKLYFGWEQREENNNVTRNVSMSDILILLMIQTRLYFWGFRH